MTARIETSREGRVLTVVNHDPATRNALSWDFYDGFRKICERASAEGVRAIVLTGAEGFFCSGGNVSGLRERSEADDATRRASVERLHGMIRGDAGLSLPDHRGGGRGRCRRRGLARDGGAT